jgi:HAD superfamily hydrolase (TIGR01549 family)
MDGVDALLARLSARYPLGIVTARPARGTRTFLDQFDLGRYFRAVASAQTAPHTKPYPDPVLWCAEQLGVPPEACLMIGDTAVDPLCGRRAGAQTVGVLCGFGSRAELERAGADVILEHTTQLAGLLGLED